MVEGGRDGIVKRGPDDKHPPAGGWRTSETWKCEQCGRTWGSNHDECLYCDLPREEAKEE